MLLHGIGGFALLLKPMELSLEEQGYFVANVTYPSLSDPIESLAVEAVEEGLGKCAARRPVADSLRYPLDGGNTGSSIPLARVDSGA